MKRFILVDRSKGLMKSFSRSVRHTIWQQRQRQQQSCVAAAVHALLLLQRSATPTHRIHVPPQQRALQYHGSDPDCQLQRHTAAALPPAVRPAVALLLLGVLLALRLQARADLVLYDDRVLRDAVGLQGESQWRRGAVPRMADGKLCCRRRRAAALLGLDGWLQGG